MDPRRAAALDGHGRGRGGAARGHGPRARADARRARAGRPAGQLVGRPALHLPLVRGRARVRRRAHLRPRASSPSPPTTCCWPTWCPTWAAAASRWASRRCWPGPGSRWPPARWPRSASWTTATRASSSGTWPSSTTWAPTASGRWRPRPPLLPSPAGPPAAACPARARRPRRRRSRSARSGGRSTVGRAQRGDVAEGAQLVGHVAASVDGASPDSASSSAASSVPDRFRMSAARFSPMPLAPGSPSDGSPRRAMKSGTCAGVDAVAPAHLGRVDPLRPLLAPAAQQRHADVGGRALEQVAVAGQDHRLAAGGLLLQRVGAQQVVGLQLGVVRAGPAHGLVQRRRALPLPRQVARHRRAVGVVGGVEIGAVGRGVRAHAADGGAGALLLGRRQDRVDRAQQRVHRLALGAVDLVRQREERPVEQVRARRPGAADPSPRAMVRSAAYGRVKMPGEGVVQALAVVAQVPSARSART